jgi:hypothetical protein
MLNAADQRQVREARKAEKLRLQAERNDLEWVVSTVQGRRFVWKLLCDAGVFQAMQGDDEFHRGVVEGRRRGGLALMLSCQMLDPTLYGRMAKEAQAMESTPEATEETPESTDTQEADV